jgi:hypothetical protein
LLNLSFKRHNEEEYAMEREVIFGAGRAMSSRERLCSDRRFTSQADDYEANIDEALEGFGQVFLAHQED